MARALNVIDEVIDGTPKYTITDNADGTKGIALANTIVTQGTALNKSFFDRIELITNYQKVTGTYDSTTGIVNYVHSYFDEDNVVDGMRLLIQGANTPIVPSTNWRDVKNSTNISSYMAIPQMIEMSNGNIMIVGSSGTNGYITIIDTSGNIVKAETSIGTYFGSPQLIEMSNGNIMIIGSGGSSSSSYTAYLCIVDQDGNIVKSSTSLGSATFTISNMIEMSNGNIMIVGYYTSGSNYYGRMAIVNQSGTIIKAPAVIDSYFHCPQLVELNNGNIMVVGSRGQSLSNYSQGKIIIYDQSGNVVVSATSIGDGFNYPQLIKMSNGNVMIVGSLSDTSNYVYTGYMCIVNQSGTIVKSATSIGDYFWRPQLLEMSNGNIMIVGSGYTDSAGSYSLYECYMTILDQSGNIVKSATLITDYMGRPQLIELSDGNIMITGARLYNYTFACAIALVKQDGTILKSNASEGTYFNCPQLLEMSNGNVLIIGYGSGSSSNTAYGYIKIIQPYASSYACSINNILTNAVITQGKTYELIYYSSSNKFIVRTVI